MIIWVYDSFGAQKGALKDFNNFVHDDEIGALDFIEFTLINDELEKNDYLVWRDDFGVWHEHIVRSVTLSHSMGIISQQVYAVNSIAELTRSYVGERNSYGFKNLVAWQRLLEDTRWTPGTMSDLGEKDIKFYHQTVYEGITSIVNKWGGEIFTTITVSANGVIERRINHVGARGEDNGLLFTYGFDMTDISRKVDTDDVYTRLHVFGQGEAIYGDDGEQSGNGRRIDFSEINDGKDYVEDNEALLKWGVIGKDNALQHSEGVAIFEDCTDPEELYVLGKLELREAVKPRVEYTANVAILADAGMQFKNARTGDTCYIRDKPLDERLNGRIMHVRRYYNTNQPTEITLGNIKRTVHDIFSEQQKRLDDLKNRSAWWDGATRAENAWLDYLMDNLNEFMNVVGGYVYWEQGVGITVYDRPIDQNPTSAIQLNGAGFRIANEKKSDGTWNWRTFGTGDGFTADLINVGILRCGSNIINLDNGTITLENGLIQDLNGKNFWNLATGQLRISADAQYIDGDTIKDLGDYFKSIHKEISDVDNALDDLDTELRQAIEDESISEAEAAAVAKLLQRVQTEQTEAISAYNQVYTNSLLTGTTKTNLYNAKSALYGTNDISGAYGTLVTHINQVIACTTAEQIKAAMQNYNTAYAAYQSNRDTFSKALKNAETVISNAYANNAASDAVESQTQDDIFNKLTNNGETQGIYLEQDPSDKKMKLYLNATYMKLGKLTDGKGNNYWDLDTGEFKLSPSGTKVGDQTLANYVSSYNSDSFASASADDVFNKLTNNGRVYGITMSGNGLYINASYINAGTLTVRDTSGTTLFSASIANNSVQIAGFTVSGNRLTGESMIISRNIIDFRSNEYNAQTQSYPYIGSVGAIWITDHSRWRYSALLYGDNDEATRGICFGLADSEAFGTSKSVSMRNVKGLLSRSREDTGVLDIDYGWNWYSSFNMHGNKLTNANIATAASLGIGDSIKDRMDFMVVTKVNPDGTIAEYVDGCSLEFTNGILTDMVKPEE